MSAGHKGFFVSLPYSTRQPDWGTVQTASCDKSPYSSFIHSLVAMGRGAMAKAKGRRGCRHLAGGEPEERSGCLLPERWALCVLFSTGWPLVAPALAFSSGLIILSPPDFLSQPVFFFLMEGAGRGGWCSTGVTASPELHARRRGAAHKTGCRAQLPGVGSSHCISQATSTSSRPKRHPLFLRSRLLFWSRLTHWEIYDRIHFPRQTK